MTVENHGFNMPKKASALKLMLLAMIGGVVGFTVVLGMAEAAGFKPELSFWITMAIGIPAGFFYLWRHRSPDNTHFDLEW